MLSDRHPNTLMTKYVIALMLHNAGYHKLAIEQMEQLINEDVIALGEDDDKTLSDMRRLAIYYRNAGYYRKALKLLERCKEGIIQNKGRDNPKALDVMEEISYSLWEIGDEKEAERIVYNVLQKRRSILGEKHKDTIKSLNDTATIQFRNNEITESISDKEQLLKEEMNLNGIDGYETQKLMSSLADLYAEAGYYEKAEDIIKQVISIRERNSGKNHRSTIDSYSQYAVMLDNMGRHNDSLELNLDVYEHIGSLYGNENTLAIDCLQNIALNYIHLGQFENAIHAMEKVLDGRRLLSGDEHRLTLESTEILADAYRGFGKKEEAKSALNYILIKLNQEFGESDHWIKRRIEEKLQSLENN